MAKVILTLTIAFILLGLVFSYLIAGTESWWGKYYYVWDKAKDCLLVWSLTFYVAGVYLFSLRALLVFFVIRLLWEFLAIPDYKLASGTEVMDLLFAILLFIIVANLIKTNGGNKDNHFSTR